MCADFRLRSVRLRTKRNVVAIRELMLLSELPVGKIQITSRDFGNLPMEGTAFDEMDATLRTFQGIFDRLVWMSHIDNLADSNVWLVL